MTKLLLSVLITLTFTASTGSAQALDEASEMDWLQLSCSLLPELVVDDACDPSQEQVTTVVTTLRAERDELQSELNTARREQQAAEKSVIELETAMAELQEAPTAASQESDALRRKIADLQQQLQEAQATVVCDSLTSALALWRHRDFDIDHLAVVEQALQVRGKQRYTTIRYDDSSFWSKYTGRDAANLRAYVRDMRIGGTAEDAIVVQVAGVTYVVFVCDCNVKAVYRLEPKPTPVEVKPKPKQPPVVKHHCPSQITVNVNGGANCTGACAAAKAAAAAARAAVRQCN